MGCCGSKRQQVARQIQAARGSATGAQAGPPGGRSVPLPPASTVQYAVQAGVPFVYDGLAELVVTGSATGRRYRFAARGARLMVDALDAPAMRNTPKLRCLA